MALQGTGFTADLAVSFDGVPATIVSATATELTVVVPETYGYPVIAVDEVSAERLLFVGSAYAGASTIDGIQEALDALPENAALRLAAGTFGAPGTSLDLDNRKLYGAGSATVLDLPDTLDLYARSTHVTVLQDLAVSGEPDVYVNRGRLSTASVAPIVPSGTVVFQDVDLTLGAFEIDDDYLHVIIHDATVDATYLYADGYGSRIDIAGSSFTLSDYWDVDTYGALSMRGTTIVAGGDVDVDIDYVDGITFDDVTVEAGGRIYVYLYDAVGSTGLSLSDTQLTAGSSIYIGSSSNPIFVEGSSLTAATYVEIDADDYGAVIDLIDTTVTAGTYALIGDGYAGVNVQGSDVTAGTYVYLYAYGNLSVVESTLTAQTDYIYGSSDYSDALLIRDSDLDAATYVEFSVYGPVLVEGGTVTAGTAFDITSWYAGDITLRGVEAITADTMYIHDGGSSYAGNNGVVTLADNGPITITDVMSLNLFYSDLVVSGNGPISAGLIDWQARHAHVTIADNERVESATDVGIYAAMAGGRLSATNTLFVADGGSGTITLETLAGELTLSGNTFTGTLVTPNNP